MLLAMRLLRAPPSATIEQHENDESAKAKSMSRYARGKEEAPCKIFVAKRTRGGANRS